MYEVTYTLDGVLKKMTVKANDAIVAQQIFTNMYQGFGKMQIIDIRRI